jgi:hypothetical protein
MHYKYLAQGIVRSNFVELVAVIRFRRLMFFSEMVGMSSEDDLIIFI